MAKKEIQYSKNTVGCSINGEIFIHPELYKYPELYTAIVNHEKKHSDGFELKDLALDLVNDDLKDHKKDFYKFIFTHPRTLLGWLPVTKVGKHWAFDAEMFVFWLLAILSSWYLAVNL